VYKDKNKTNNHEIIILQCHVDMVCECEKGFTHDFLNDGLDLYVDGDFIKARGTTLGADNGIGLAMILAILDEKDISHPNLEAVFTTQEETTMMGASSFDTSKLKGHKMISTDGMSQDELWLGCASGTVFEYKLKKNKLGDVKNYKLFELSLTGATGGHSGMDINKNRINVIKEIVNVLKSISKEHEILISNLECGAKPNVIPLSAKVTLGIKESDFYKVKNKLTKKCEEIKKLEFDDSKNIEFYLEEKFYTDDLLSLSMTNGILDLVYNIPNGVFAKDMYGNALVSLNIGELKCNDEYIEIRFSIRSNKKEISSRLIDKVNSVKKDIENKMQHEIKETVSELLGYESKLTSKFVNDCIEIYKNEFNKKPRLIDVHVGLEVGILANSISNFEFVTIAPNIYDAHSLKERLSISSTISVYAYLKQILEHAN